MCAGHLRSSHNHHCARLYAAVCTTHAVIVPRTCQCDTGRNVLHSSFQAKHKEQCRPQCVVLSDAGYPKLQLATNTTPSNRYRMQQHTILKLHQEAHSCAQRNAVCWASGGCHLCAHAQAPHANTAQHQSKVLSMSFTTSRSWPSSTTRTTSGRTTRLRASVSCR